MTTTDLRYPIGRPEPGLRVTGENLKTFLLQIAELPDQVRDAIEGLSNSQLDTPYRPEGWTVRQVVHHLADNDLHWYLRIKLALTLDRPTIQPYDENHWAALQDARSGPVEPSLLMLDGVHSRLTQVLESMSEADWSREFLHPARGPVTIDINVPVYAWHGRHHVAHITELRKRMGWG